MNLWDMYSIHTHTHTEKKTHINWNKMGHRTVTDELIPSFLLFVHILVYKLNYKLHYKRHKQNQKKIHRRKQQKKKKKTKHTQNQNAENCSTKPNYVFEYIYFIYLFFFPIYGPSVCVCTSSIVHSNLVFISHLHINNLPKQYK